MNEDKLPKIQPAIHRETSIVLPRCKAFIQNGKLTSWLIRTDFCGGDVVYSLNRLRYELLELEDAIQMECTR